MGACEKVIKDIELQKSKEIHNEYNYVIRLIATCTRHAVLRICGSHVCKPRGYAHPGVVAGAVIKCSVFLYENMKMI